MTLPNFFIVGAAKSGTSSLYYYLKQHPEVFMSEVKEPLFFLDYRGGVNGLAAYEKLFEGVKDEKAVGEASTAYLYAEESPGLIRSAVPGARIIIMLRNPAEMAYSLWRFISRIGKRGESLSFVDALEAEGRRMIDPAFRRGETWHAQFYYFHRGLYHDQVKRYFDTFGRDKVMVFIFEDFAKDPLKTCREAFAFLGVAPDFVPDFRKQNVGNVRHRGLHKLLTSPKPYQAKLMEAVPSFVSGPFKESLVRLNSRPARPMDPEIRRRLLEKYAPDIERLASLLERDLSRWLD